MPLQSRGLVLGGLGAAGSHLNPGGSWASASEPFCNFLVASRQLVAGRGGNSEIFTQDLSLAQGCAAGSVTSPGLWEAVKLFHVHPDLGEASSASLLSALSDGPREDPCSARRKDRKRWVVNREDAMLGTWREAALWKKQFTVMGICLESPHPTTKCILAFFFQGAHV